MDVEITQKNNPKKILYALCVLLALLAVFIYQGNGVVLSEDKQLHYELLQMANKIKVTGRVNSEQKVKITAPEDALVEKVFVSNGDKVQAGDIIIKLRSDRLLNQYKKEKLELDLAVLNLESERVALAKNIYEKQSQLDMLAIDVEESKFALSTQKALKNKGAVSKLELKKSEFSLQKSLNRYQAQKKLIALLQQTNQKIIQTNEKQVALKKSLVAEVEQRITKLSLKAPISGKLSDLIVDVGDSINNASSVAVIHGIDSYRFELSVPDYMYSKLKVGGQVKVHIDGDKWQEAKLLSVSNDAENGYLHAIAVASNVAINTSLPLGQSIKALVDLEGQKSVIKLSDFHAYDGSDNTLLYIVNPNQPGQAQLQSFAVLMREDSDLFLEQPASFVKGSVITNLSPQSYDFKKVLDISR